MDQSMPGPPVFHCLPELVKFMLVASMPLSSHLVLCCPLLLLPSHFPSIRVFSRKYSLLMRWPKYWSLSFRICPSSEHSGLISFKMDRFVLFAVQGTPNSLLQHHNSKASILQWSAFFDWLIDWLIDWFDLIWFDLYPAYLDYQTTLWSCSHFRTSLLEKS